MKRTLKRLLVGLLLILLATPVLAVSPPVIYNGQILSSYVLGFLLSGTGNIAPIVDLTGGNTGFSDMPGVAVDASGNLWVSDRSNDKISEFASGVTGNQTPAVTISGGSTGLNDCRDLAFDSSGNLWVTNLGASSVVEFSAAQLVAGGNITPNITLSGASTTLSGPDGISIASDDTMYVAHASGVAVFAAGASGNTAPIHTLTGTNSKASGVAVDSSFNYYVVDTGQNDIRKFNAGHFGNNQTPDATITGASTLINTPRAVTLDSSNNIYVSDGVPSIKEWPAGTSGNTAPSQNITGGSTLLAANPGYLAIWASAATPTPTATATATATNTATPTATATCTPGPGCMTPTPAGSCTPNAGVRLLNSSGAVMNGGASATSANYNWCVVGVDTSGNLVNSFTGTASGVLTSPDDTVRFVDNAGCVCNGSSDSAIPANYQATYRVCDSSHKVAPCSAGESATCSVLPNLSVNIIDANGFIDDTF